MLALAVMAGGYVESACLYSGFGASSWNGVLVSMERMGAYWEVSRRQLGDF